MQSRFILDLESTAREWNASSANFLTEKLPGNTELKVTERKIKLSGVSLKWYIPSSFPIHTIHTRPQTYLYVSPFTNPLHPVANYNHGRPLNRDRTNGTKLRSPLLSPPFKINKFGILSHSNLSPLVIAETRHARYEPVHSPLVSKLDTLETREDVAMPEHSVLIFQFPMSPIL